MFPLNTKSLAADTKYFKAARHTDVNCLLHLHYSMEIVYVYEGEIIMNVNGRDRTISRGEATLMLPFEQHSFLTPKASKCFVIEFSPEFTPDFYDEIKGKALVTEVFSLDCDTINLCDKILPDGFLNKTNSRAVLYPICLEILNKCSFAQTKKMPDKTFIGAIKYIQQNYGSGDLSLTSTANALGVHSVYLSRVFTQNADMSFTAYVNLVRCTFAAEKICNEPNLTLSEIAFDSGFGSIRSFNRAFLSFFSMTPKEYRIKYENNDS